MTDSINTNRIELMRTSDSRLDIDSLKLELWIDKNSVSEVYFADGKWKITMSSLGGVVTIDWNDFLDAINEFQKFIASESSILIEEAKKSQND